MYFVPIMIYLYSNYFENFRFMDSKEHSYWSKVQWRYCDLKCGLKKDIKCVLVSMI